MDAPQKDDEENSGVRAPSSVARAISRGWPDAAAKRPRGMASDLLFQSGCRDLNPGPLDPQSLKGGILR